MVFYSATVRLLPARRTPLVGLTGGVLLQSVESKGSRQGHGVAPTAERLSRGTVQAAYPCKAPLPTYFFPLRRRLVNQLQASRNAKIPKAP